MSIIQLLAEGSIEATKMNVLLVVASFVSMSVLIVSLIRQFDKKHPTSESKRLDRALRNSTGAKSK